MGETEMLACARVGFRKQINSKIYIYLTTENAEKHGKARLREGEFLESKLEIN